MGRARTLVGISVFWLALSVLGDGFTALVVPLRISLVADPAWAATAIGLITFTGLAAAMLVQPFAGAVSDALRPRWGRRPMLLAGTAAILAALLAFALLEGVAGILVGFVLLMVAASVAQAAQQGFIPDLVRRDWRGRAAGAKGVADVGGAFIGFLLLGALLVGGDVVPALAAVAVVVVAAAVLTIALVREPRESTPPRPRPSLVNSYRLDFRRHAGFVRVVAARFLFLLAIFAVGRFFLLFVGERLALDPATAAAAAGGLLAALTLITALAALPAGWAADRFGRGRTMVAGSVLGAGGVLLLLGAWSAEAILLAGGLMAIGSATFSAANWALAADLAPPAEAGRFLGIANFGTAGAAAAAGLLGAPVDLARALLPGLGYGAVLLVALVPLGLSAVAARSLISRDSWLVAEAVEETTAA